MKEHTSLHNTQTLYKGAVRLLRSMIATSSLSREEHDTATLIEAYIHSYDIPTDRIQNNVIAYSKHFDASKPSIILNSHHDTVKPNPKYTRDPYAADIKGDKLYGLGSNDAGGCLVSLISTFIAYYDSNLTYNFILIASAEEEISGAGGVELVFNSEDFKAKYKGHPDDFAIVGEPTLMQMAVAERGLMVIDATCHGKAGHAAREEGDSALIKACNDIVAISLHSLPKVSKLLGPVKMSPTVIHTENKAHNVVPATCDYVIDCRINELYTFEEVLASLQSICSATLKPRSMRLKSSMIPLDHPIVKAGLNLGQTYYGSPTTSDKALIPVTALKCGPGDSARSHTADEYIYLPEIWEGIEGYISMIAQLV